MRTGLKCTELSLSRNSVHVVLVCGWRASSVVLCVCAVTGDRHFAGGNAGSLVANLCLWCSRIPWWGSGSRSPAGANLHHPHTLTHAHSHAYTYMYACKHVHLCTCTCVGTLYIYMCTCTYVHIRAHTHTSSEINSAGAVFNVKGCELFTYLRTHVHVHRYMDTLARAEQL